jgi:glycosyltransferase involved in cell wall biosynthesis
MTPLVSVLVPAYRGAAHLDVALAGALAQTHEHLEVLVADDASPDGGATLEVARAHAAADPRVRVIAREHNLGAPENQRRLLTAARGALIKPLLQDDLLEPGCVTRLLELLHDEPGAALAFSRRRLIDEHGAPLPDQAFNAALAAAPGPLHGRDLGDAMLVRAANLVGEMTTVLLRRDALDARTLWTWGGHEFHAVADVALWLRLLARGPAAYTPEALSAFRLHLGQSSHNPAIVRRGAVEWPLLVLLAPALGFLADPGRLAAARGRALVGAAGALRLCAGHPHELARAQAIAAALQDEPVPAWPAAVARPRLTPAAVFAAVAELRSLAAVGATSRPVVAVAPDEVAAAVPLVEQALAIEDFDLELVPAAGPLPADWLSVD